MSEARKLDHKATYQDILDLPEGVRGEIIDGELIVSPRPSPKHLKASYALGHKIGGPFEFGENGGPGGWWIVPEPEVKFGENTLVPDLAGWRKERLPSPPNTNWFEVIPDWICEVISPSSTRHDRVSKWNTYATHGVNYYWLIDPIAQTLEALRLDQGHWVAVGNYGGDQKVRVEPFDAIEIDLAQLWWG